MTEPMLVELSSDEDEPLLPSDVRVAAPGCNSNENKLETTEHSGTKLSTSVLSNSDLSIKVDKLLNQINGLNAPKDQESLTGKEPLRVNVVGEHKPVEKSKLDEKSGIQATNSDDDMCEIVDEINVPKNVNSRLINFGDDEYYKKAVILYRKDPAIMKKLIIDLIKKKDSLFREKEDEIKELKARQEYREKEMTQLKKEYESLQSDVYRLGNPLDMVTQCNDDAFWDVETTSIKVSGHLLREVKLADLEIQTARKSAASGPPSVIRTNITKSVTDNDIELSDDDDEVKCQKVELQSVQNMPSGEPVVYELHPSSQVLAALDPKNLACTWYPGQILQTFTQSGKKFFQVMFDSDSHPNLTVPPSCIVVAKTQPVKFPVRVRVVAGLRSSPDSQMVNKYLAGFVAELPISANDQKYLILFDSGDACYVPHHDVFANFHADYKDVVKQLEANPETERQATFLKSYFDKYPERLLVRPALDEKIRVMIDGLWYSSKVKSTRHSLMQVRVRRLKMRKWIYRGSYYLKPIFDQLFPNHKVERAQKAQFRPIRTTVSKGRRTGRRHQTFHYIETRNADSDSDDSESSNFSVYSSIRSQTSKFVKKSSQKYPSRTVLEKIQKNVDYPLNFIVNETLWVPEQEHNERYKPHYCSSRCTSATYDATMYRDVNQYCVPLILGWRREMRIVDRNDIPNIVCYKPPCGKSLFSFRQLSAFLHKTKCDLPISLFSFEPTLEVFPDIDKMGCYYMQEDISVGLEPKSISVVNQYENESPTFFKYQVKPTFSKKVQMGGRVALDDGFFDQQFMSCCSCEDQCQDSEKCECQQLTINQCKVKFPKDRKKWYSGYRYKIAEEFVETGLFECNSNCRCNDKCYNRVASLGIQHRLQLFKTAKKGWGVRTLHDIPPGSFICAYMARILTPDEGNDDRNIDVYFADLDLLCRLEQGKEELLVLPEDFISSGEGSSSGEDADWRYDTGGRCDYIPKRKKNAEDQRHVSNYEMFKIQEYLGDDCAYVMDANEEGNIGRYFNHSCDPNAYVQNVFIHTHDPRFPLIALFTCRLIKAFEEITWDYGYTVGSVPGRHLDCHCGAKHCRKRLL